jgi:serine kinase of HPr protein (carbohydrate metabolism regulator)
LVGIPCIVVTNFQDVDEQTSQRAEKEGITILKTPLTTYQAVAVLSRLGLPGLRRNV